MLVPSGCEGLKVDCNWFEGVFKDQTLTTLIAPSYPRSLKIWAGLCGFVWAQTWVLGHMLVLGGSEGLKMDSDWFQVGKHLEILSNTQNHFCWYQCQV